MATIKADMKHALQRAWKVQMIYLKERDYASIEVRYRCTPPRPPADGSRRKHLDVTTSGEDPVGNGAGAAEIDLALHWLSAEKNLLDK
ncbi:hypothetical protein Acor_67010 [Acrocarpospora corrugata]|uniref:Uncharacterized protein n=1 Tax=Acrocarpospora corrugata TaxID=35763 RepID=A0A5M3WBT9_9ACTN|nr:hypothetical protein [Acrocarpospora corrugata]GES04633.1 hypothetical protein Acor_67010 [Acrocarpospora corrugata]